MPHQHITPTLRHPKVSFEVVFPTARESILLAPQPTTSPVTVFFNRLNKNTRFRLPQRKLEFSISQDLNQVSFVDLTAKLFGIFRNYTTVLKILVVCTENF
jgi:hypothetical protein